MNELKEFLDRFNDLLEKNNEIKEEERKKGNKFNIFNVLKLERKELIHSAFIAELLNPNGDHGMKDEFLKAFIKVLKIENLGLRTKSAIIEKEKWVGKKTKTQGGIIDILITDNKRAVIIENKIYASDQDNQLLRYKNYAQREYGENYRLYYLTLDCHEASDSSIGNYSSMSHNCYECISYDGEIYKWINICIELSTEKPLVHQTLIAYRDLLKQLTNQDDPYHNKMLDLMIDKKYALAISEIFQLEDDWFNALLAKYVFDKLEIYAKGKNLLFTYDSSEACMWFNKEEWRYYCIKVESDDSNYWGPMYYGITYYNTPNKASRICKSTTPFDCFPESPERDWPYGYAWLDENYKQWNNSIVKSIINGELADYIMESVSKVLREIEIRKIKMP